MKDIDFDELDRAVSSVLGQKTPEDAGAPAAAGHTTTRTTDDTAVTVTTNTSGASESSSTPTLRETEENKTPVASAPLAVKRRGKFMDMVHPSADMKPKSPTTMAAKPSPRTLAPLTTNLSNDTSATDTPDEEPVALLEPTTEPTASVDESKALIGAEPAPVETDLLDSSVQDDTAVTDTDKDEATDEPAPAPQSAYVDPLSMQDPVAPAGDEQPTDDTEQAPAASADTSPQPTPFLTDTKVDKRPLGAFGDADTPVVSEPSEAPLAESSPASDTQSAPVVPLPRELQPDVVEVESVQENEETQNTTTASPFATNVAAAVPESDGRVEGHPLFDTSTYHEPIAAVHAKSTPVWVWWLVGLAGCLAVGAGVGYFLFTAGL